MGSQGGYNLPEIIQKKNLTHKHTYTHTYLSYFAIKLTSRTLHHVHKILNIIIHSNLINLLSQK